MPLPAVLSLSRCPLSIKYPIRSAGAAVLLALALTACAHTDAAPSVTMTQVRQQIAQGHSFDAFANLLELAPKGDPEAQYELGSMYHMGTVGAADFTKARTWYLRAANQGNADAMLQLAKMNGLGQGGPVDKKEAVKWLTIAGNSGKLSPDVAAKLEDTRASLTSDLTAADLAAANDAAHAFRAKPES